MSKMADSYNKRKDLETVQTTDGHWTFYRRRVLRSVNVATGLKVGS